MQGSVVLNSGGLGDFFLSTNDPGAANACGVSYASFLTNPMCWGNSWSDWQNAFYGVSATAPGATVTGAPGTPANIVTPVTGSDPGAIDDLISDLVTGEGAAQQAIDSSSLLSTAPAGSTGCTVFGFSCTNFAIGVAVALGAAFLLGGRR